MNEDSLKLWQEIRARRAQPVGLAADDPERAATFRAALRQAQEFADAAAAAGYATRPLPQFYCLSAGIRALCAAVLPGEHWHIYGHGARVETQPTVLDTRIIPKPSQREHPDMLSAVQMIARTTTDRADLLSEPVTIREIWAAAPQVPDLPSDLMGGAAHPLTAHMPFLRDIADRAQRELRVEIALDGLDPSLPDDQLAAALRAYPTLAAAQPLGSLADTDQYAKFYVRTDTQPRWVNQPPGPLQLPHGLGRGWTERAPVVSMPLEPSDDHPNERAAAAFAALGNPTEDTTVRVVVPGLGGSKNVSFLTTWWLLLLGQSQLVRYEPAVWTTEIDPDTSPLAVPLEQVADRAEYLIPHAISEACGQAADGT